MTLLVIAFAAGFVTILAPCILPLLPAVVGGSASAASRWSPLRITLSLVVSVVGFALLLKTSASCASLPDVFWRLFSGVILIAVGAATAFPTLWSSTRIAAKLNIFANRALGASSKKSGWLRDVLIGASLGPVFTTCSPTYFIIIGVILPESLAQGVVYLFFYAAGLSAALLALAYAGNGLVRKVEGSIGTIKVLLGTLVIIAGILVIAGVEERFQKYLFHAGVFDVTRIENSLLKWGGF